MAPDRRLTRASGKAVGVAVAAQVVTASLLVGLAVVNGVSGGERVITFLCVALALSFAIGGVTLSSLRRVDRLHTWMLVLGLFVAGYLLSGIEAAVFVAVAGAGAWLLGRSAGKRLGR